jgi:DUF4097 and DUF4098 domain-containing protein YvlB
MRNTYIYIALSILVLFLMRQPVWAQEEIKEQLTVALSDPSKPATLKVSMVNGSIKVVGYDGKDVQVEAVVPDHKESENPKPAPDGMKRIASTGFELTAKEASNKVVVETESHRRRVNLTIRVPRRSALDLSTVNGGTITVENVTGAMEISNVNGPITLTDVSGSVVANTVNGSVVVKFKEVAANTPMAFTTLNGNIDVTFAGNIKASPKIKSDRGEVFTDFDMEIEKRNQKEEKRNASGVYRVSIDDWVYGKINGGGPEMLFKNMNGNIYIRKAKG